MLDTWKKACCIMSKIRGDTDLIFLEMFKSSYYQDLSLSVWLAHTPPELVMAHLKIDKATLDAISSISKTKPVLMPLS
jgi:oxalate decarboxylase